MPSLPTAGLRPETVSGIGAVVEAMRLAAGGVQDAVVTVKDGRDVVTAVDIAVEDAIRTRLAAVSDLHIVGEERGGSPPADGSAYWLLDPICGTRNFASGLPLYCSNLALIEAGEATAAVIGDPTTDEVFVAERGNGAWALVQDRRRAIAASDATRTVVTDVGKSTDGRHVRAAAFARLVIAADRWDFRSLSTTLSLPYLAAGRVSAYVVFSIGSLHSAAGALLATEAGATLSDIDGQPWTLASDSLLACATSDLHAELLSLLTSSR